MFEMSARESGAHSVASVYDRADYRMPHSGTLSRASLYNEAHVAQRQRLRSELKFETELLISCATAQLVASESSPPGERKPDANKFLIFVVYLGPYYLNVLSPYHSL